MLYPLLLLYVCHPQVGLQDVHGRSPLHAVWMGRAAHQVAASLLSAGARDDLQDSYGHTSADLQRERSVKQHLEKLEQPEDGHAGRTLPPAVLRTCVGAGVRPPQGWEGDGTAAGPRC